MIRFAVIGTNWISHSFCNAALASGHMEPVAIYSRTLKTAQNFAATYGLDRCYTDLEAMAAQPDIDAVYIASPNSFHAPQATLCIRHGKHVLVEKPMASNQTETEQLIALAKEHQVILLEGMKSRYVPNFAIIRGYLAELGTLQRAYLSYCQYSSRYQRYLDGENPNTFNPAFSNGSLMDIGVYPLSVAVDLFGAPDSLHTSGSLLASGADAHGTLTLGYGHFEVVITHSKVSDSYIPSEIQGEHGCLQIDAISRLKGLRFHRRGEEKSQDIATEQASNEMLYEATTFADLIEAGAVDHPGLEQSRLVSQLLTEARRQIGIVYPADNFEA